MKNLTDEMLKQYSYDELIELKNNIKKYIVPLWKKKIKWKILSSNEMEEFIKENYIVNEDYVSWLDLGEESLLGMSLLPFPPYNKNLSFLIGTIKNKANKETLIGCIVFCKNFDFGINYDKLTFIEMVEINYFYQGHGLLKVMLNEFCKEIDKEQNIVMTIESSKGRLCRVMEHLKERLKNISFKKDIRFSLDVNDSYIKSLKK